MAQRGGAAVGVVFLASPVASSIYGTNMIIRRGDPERTHGKRASDGFTARRGQLSHSARGLVGKSSERRGADAGSCG